jgi:hypothetical protein
MFHKALAAYNKASYYMDIEPLVNLTSRAIATQVSGKSTDEIRETFYNASCEAHSSQFATRYRLQKRIRNKNAYREGTSNPTPYPVEGTYFAWR